ncbi:hypothetical protein AB0D59_22640 [Streptomyces sp. NPDC048417]|uniref:hypothetical protein n=1 Tax=Streptomyces sp. NPDC048417 TaxID=3155387 RepID=UPI0034193AC4
MPTGTPPPLPPPDREPGDFVERAGRLISRRESLDLLPGLGAPAQRWTAHRARLTLDYWGPATDALTVSYD